MAEENETLSIVKTIYAFTGSEAGDLTFREDEIIRVFRKVGVFLLFFIEI